MMHDIYRVDVRTLHQKNILAEAFQRNGDTVFGIKLIILYAMDRNGHIIDVKDAVLIGKTSETEALLLHTDDLVLIIAHFDDQIIKIRGLIRPRKDKLGIELRSHKLDALFRDDVGKFFSLCETMLRKII